jgi:prepilin-type N-terminal cleavage/methylation domain-containing protein
MTANQPGEITGNRGLTMIEVVVVLIVLAILTPFVVSRFTTSNVELIAQTDVLKSHLRYAQIKAMGDTVSWGINVSSSTTYTLYKNNLTATSNLPGDTSPVHTLTNGATVSVTAGGVSTVAFNEWGTPINGSGTPLNVNVILTLSHGGQSGTITVTKNTGFVP